MDVSYTNWLYELDIPNTQDWLLLGDFNYIRAPDNCNKPGGSTHDMFTFNDIIRQQNLIELPVKGRTYTWSNMQLNPLQEQLDWLFTSLHWTNVYPKTLVKPLGKPVSDHIPSVVTMEPRFHVAYSSYLYPTGSNTLASWTLLERHGTNR